MRRSLMDHLYNIYNIADSEKSVPQTLGINQCTRGLGRVTEEREGQSHAGQTQS